MKRPDVTFVSSIGLMLASAILKCCPAVAQIVPDNSLGRENSVVVPNVNIIGSDGNSINSDRIDGGAIRGNNLFHSFQEFNINEGRGAYFSNPEGITNILSRVTGENISNISGILGVLGNANLFLINPNGIVFGPNARLDVGGSFFASTADGILFENGFEFTASNPESPPLLTIRLRIEAGGNISAGTLGNGDAGNVTINASESILLDGTEILPNRDFTTNISALTASSGTAGNVTLNTGQLLIRNGGFVSAGTDGEGDAGTININATDWVELSGVGTDQSPLKLGVLSDSSGNAGTINITTGDLRIRDGSVIAASAAGEGNAGNITISASGTIDIFSILPVSPEFFGAITAFSAGEGDAGNITLTANQVLVQDGSGLNVAALSSGNAGTINITAADTVEITGTGLEGTLPSQVSASTFGTGNAGTITIGTQNLVLRDGGRVEVETQNAGNAGQIAIAADSVTLTGVSINGIPTQLVAATSGTGSAGNITVRTGQLSLADGAEVVASTTDEGEAGTINLSADVIELAGTQPSLITAKTEAEGNAGDIVISANQFTTVADSGVEASSTGTGDGGTIEVTASESVLLRDSGFLTALTEQTGNAGDVTVQTPDLILQNQGEINVRSLSTGIPGNINVKAANLQLTNQSILNANSEAGQGGSINLQSRDLRVFNNSSIRATGSEGGQTFDGNIGIDANLLVLLGSSEIITDASNPTGGSNINIRPLGGSELAVLQSQNTTIRAAGELSIDDTLNFDPPESLEITVVDPNDLIAQEFCRQRGTSQFTITGRGGIASSPNDIFTGDRTQVSLVEPVRSRSNSSISTQPSRTEPNQPRSSADIIPARGWIRDQNGDVILVSYDPTKTGIRRQSVQHSQCQP